MKWKESTASKCRWAEYLPWAGLDDYAAPEVLFDASEDNFQGTVFVLVKFDTYADDGGSYALVEYSYGSCSGCDTWENLPKIKVFQEIVKEILFLDNKEMLRAHRAKLGETIKETDYRFEEYYKPLFEAIDKEIADEKTD